MGNKPDFRAVVNVGDKVWDEVGAGWSKNNGNVSIQLNVTPIPKDGKMSFLSLLKERAPNRCVFYYFKTM